MTAAVSITLCKSDAKRGVVSSAEGLHSRTRERAHDRGNEAERL